MTGTKTSFEDFLSVVETGQNKTASLNSSTDGNILAKLAEELNGGGSAPTQEGEVKPADASQAAAPATVVGTTDAVASPQLTMAGGDVAAAAAGESPAPTKPARPITISANDGAEKTVETYGKSPAAVAAAAAGAGGSEKTAEQIQAESIGSMIADSFLDSLVKQAEQGQYQEAVVLLKEAGLLDNYENIDGLDGLDKVASQEEDFSALTKIANREEITHEDMIKAAHEYQVICAMDEEEELLEKEAALEEELEDEELLEKEAALVDAEARIVAREDAFELQKEASLVDSLMQDQAVVSAVAVLKDRGVL